MVRQWLTTFIRVRERPLLQQYDLGQMVGTMLKFLRRQLRRWNFDIQATTSIFQKQGNHYVVEDNSDCLSERHRKIYRAESSASSFSSQEVHEEPHPLPSHLPQQDS